MRKEKHVSKGLTETILRECHEIYTDGDDSLSSVADLLEEKLLAPQKKITVMLMGNHSAGKSSFINWYIGEKIQRTGVAIETQGFTIVTTGKKRETLSGNATVHLYPEFKPIMKIKGMTNYIQTEITSSKNRHSELVHFIDTPGLVDGDMKYPFDVNEAILWTANMVDLILVFFDPIGQALCKRTLDVVESLSEAHQQKLRYFLSKADEAGDECDRQRVLMQIVQELCRRPNLNKTCFDMPTIFIEEKKKSESTGLNQIEKVCGEIEKTINMTVQTTLNTLESDCEMIAKKVETTIKTDDQNRADNLRGGARWLFYNAFLFLLPSLTMTNQIRGILCTSSTNPSFCDYLKFAERDPFLKLIHVFPSEYQNSVIKFLIFLWICVFILAKFITRSRPTISWSKKKELQRKAAHVMKVVLPKKEQLYTKYLKESIEEEF